MANIFLGFYSDPSGLIPPGSFQAITNTSTTDFKVYVKISTSSTPIPQALMESPANLLSTTLWQSQADAEWNPKRDMGPFDENNDSFWVNVMVKGKPGHAQVSNVVSNVKNYEIFYKDQYQNGIDTVNIGEFISLRKPNPGGKIVIGSGVPEPIDNYLKKFLTVFQRDIRKTVEESIAKALTLNNKTRKGTAKGKK